MGEARVCEVARYAQEHGNRAMETELEVDKMNLRLRSGEKEKYKDFLKRNMRFVVRSTSIYV
jgi:hypothetical protein